MRISAHHSGAPFLNFKAMQKVTKTVFCCDYCKKVATVAAAIQRHEQSCKKNPKNIALCYNCAHFVEGEKEKVRGKYYVQGFYYENIVERQYEFPAHTCDADKKLFNGCKLHPETKDILKNNGWGEMPTKVSGCPKFQQII